MAKRIIGQVGVSWGDEVVVSAAFSKTLSDITLWALLEAMKERSIGILFDPGWKEDHRVDPAWTLREEPT